MLRNRIELFALELQEEKYWLISTLVWGAATVFFGGVTILLVVGAVVFLAPESARGWILLGFAVAFSFITVNAVAALRRSLRNRPPPLSDTLGELRKDLDWIQSQD
jgi:uncharacterized membrane protein YqjE